MKTIATTKLAVVTLVTSVIALLSSCRNDFDFDYAHGNATESDIAYNDRFNELIGEIDPNHTWSTAQQCGVSVIVSMPGQNNVTIYTSNPFTTNAYVLSEFGVEGGTTKTIQFDSPAANSTLYAVVYNGLTRMVKEFSVDASGNGTLEVTEKDTRITKDNTTQTRTTIVGSNSKVTVENGGIEYFTYKQLRGAFTKLPEGQNNLGKLSVEQNFMYKSDGTPITIYPIMANTSFWDKVGLYYYDTNNEKVLVPFYDFYDKDETQPERINQKHVGFGNHYQDRGDVFNANAWIDEYWADSYWSEGVKITVENGLIYGFYINVHNDPSGNHTGNCEHRDSDGSYTHYSQQVLNDARTHNSSFDPTTWGWGGFNPSCYFPAVATLDETVDGESIRYLCFEDYCPVKYSDWDYNDVVFIVKGSGETEKAPEIIVEPNPDETPETPAAATYNVYYYKQGTTEPVPGTTAKTNVSGKNEGESVTEQYINVEDWDLMSNTTQTITLTSGTNNIIFYYKPRTRQSYIIACEDLGNSATSDFDYNDIVFEVIPFQENGQTKVKVKPLAEGGTLEAYILFDPNGSGNFNSAKKIGPNGKEEVHKWLTGNASQSFNEMLNTGSEAKYTSAEEVVLIDESGNISMANNWDKYFCVLVNKDGIDLTGEQVSYSEEGVVFSKNTTSTAPRLICISDNNWFWMQERVQITEAYQNFVKWAANAASASQWHKEIVQPQQDYMKMVTRREIVVYTETDSTEQGPTDQNSTEADSSDPSNTEEEQPFNNAIIKITAGNTTISVTDPTSQVVTLEPGTYTLSVDGKSCTFSISENSNNGNHNLARITGQNKLEIKQNNGLTQTFTIVVTEGGTTLTSCRIQVLGTETIVWSSNTTQALGTDPNHFYDLSSIKQMAQGGNIIRISYQNINGYLKIHYGNQWNTPEITLTLDGNDGDTDIVLTEEIISKLNVYDWKIWAESNGWISKITYFK